MLHQTNAKSEARGENSGSVLETLQHNVLMASTRTRSHNPNTTFTDSAPYVLLIASDSQKLLIHFYIETAIDSQEGNEFIDVLTRNFVLLNHDDTVLLQPRKATEDAVLIEEQ